MKRLFIPSLVLTCLLLCLALSSGLAEEALDLASLAPVELPASSEAQVAELYCGPTQGFFRHDGLTLDTGKPFVYFGQHDCWAMVAGGTLEDMGPVGWVESAAAIFPEEPQLSFDDALPAMVEEDTFLTDEPFAASPVHLCELARGTQVLLLAQYEGWVYVQADLEDTPIRAFLPLSAVL